MTMAVSRPGPARKPDSEDADNRVYRRITFASDDYVPWSVGRLRLRTADLSRLQSAGVPVLRGHVSNEVVGTVISVEKTDGAWRSDWRLPKIQANVDTFSQMDSGILRGVSVGGNIIWSTLVLDNESDADFNDADSLQFSADWTLIEQSLTALPADTRAGVDRALAGILERDGAIFDSLISPTGIATNVTPDLFRRIEQVVKIHNEAIAATRREKAMTTPTLETIPQEAIEKAIADQLARSESLKSLTQLPAEIAKLSQSLDAEVKCNMEYRAKLDQIQFGGAGVLKQNNWNPNDPLVDLGVILRLTREDDSVFPAIDADRVTSLEESIIERSELGKAGRDTLARIPYAALAAREDQLQLRRSTVAEGAGARPLDISVLGNGGVVLSSWSPVLGRMDVRLGVEGAQKVPWATAQPTAAGGAEGSAIPVTNLVLNNVEYLPVSIASAYELTSSLRGTDDGTFEAIARMSITDILLDQVTGQILVGGGTNQINGLWGRTGVQNTDYGAAATDFDREDVVDWFDNVRLAKTDGGMYTCVMGSNLWKLAEKTPRGVDGTSSAGYTAISDYLLETTGPHMGMVESEMAYHYADFDPSGVTNGGLFFKGDRVVVWFFGRSLTLEYVPTVARKETYKIVAEVNFEIHRPAQNCSRIKQS